MKKVAMCALLLLVSFYARATDWTVYDWVGESGGSWDDVGNWRTSGVALAGDEKPWGWGARAVFRLTADATVMFSKLSYLGHLSLESSTPCTLTLVGEGDSPVDLRMANGSLPTVNISAGCTIRLVNCNMTYVNSTDYAYLVRGGGTLVYDTPQVSLHDNAKLPVSVTNSTVKVSVSQANGALLPKLDLACDGGLVVESDESRTPAITGCGKVTIAEGATLRTGSVGSGALDRLTGSGTLQISTSSAITNGLHRVASLFNGTVKQSAGFLSLASRQLVSIDDPRLIAYWKFDDPEDPGKDSGPNGMTLKPNREGDTWPDLLSKYGDAKYKAGNAHGLSLVDVSKVSLLPKSTVNPDFTFAAWVKDGNGWDGGGFFRWGDPSKNWYSGVDHFEFGIAWSNWTAEHETLPTPWKVGFPAHGYADFYVTGDRNTSHAAWTDTTPCGGWHHVALTCGPSETKFYFDGVLVYTDPRGSETYHYDTPTDLVVGEMGAFDEGMLFNAALSADEVASLMYGLSGPVTLVQGEAATVDTAGTLWLKGGNLAGSMGGCGTVALAGSVELTGTSSITPKAVAFAEGMTLTYRGASAQSEPISVKDPIVLPKSLSWVFEFESKSMADDFPLLSSEGGFRGTTADWSALIRVNGSVREAGKVNFRMRGTTVFASIVRPGTVLTLR